MRVRLFALLALAAGSAQAHHSFGMFDMSANSSVHGTVKTFEWTNPHAWIWVTADGQDGKRGDWGFECAALSMLRRMGFTKDSFTPGETVTIDFHPVKSGQQGGSFIGATFADGHTLGRKPGGGGPAPGGSDSPAGPPPGP